MFKTLFYIQKCKHLTHIVVLIIFAMTLQIYLHV